MSLLEAYPDLRKDFLDLFESCGWTVTEGGDRAAVQQAAAPVQRLLAARCPLCAKKTSYAAAPAPTATRAGLIQLVPPAKAARRALAELGLPAIKPLAWK